MKMFNWVHKKFHYSPLKGESAKNVEKNSEIAMKEEDIYKQGLLKHVNEMIEALDNWKMNGNLTICKVGFEKSSKPRNLQGRKYFILKKENKVEEEDNNLDQVDEELNPLLKWMKIKNKMEESEEYSIAFEKYQVIMAIDRRIQSEKSKGRRITLADLFMEDADVKVLEGKTELHGKLMQDLHTKLPDIITTTTTKDSFAKKDVEPRRKFGLLMRKMMKRKIHSEIDDKQMLIGERRSIIQ